MKNCFLIVNFNDYKSTKHLIDNIIDYQIIDHILIVDNNSSEKEKQKIKTIKNQKIEIIYNDDNLGYSQAINIGARYLIEKYGEINLIISNSDIIIMSEEDLIKLVDLLNYEHIGLVAPNIMERGLINRGMKRIKPSTDILLNLPLLRYFVSKKSLVYRDDYYEGETSIVDAISGCFFLISSVNLQKINFMDENVFLYYEDYILSKKINDLGLMVVVANNVRVKHNFSVSVDRNIPESEKYLMLKKSQYYYHTTYNNVNSFQRSLLKISSSLKLWSIRIKGVLRKLASR